MTNNLIHSFAHDLRSYLRTAATRSQLLERDLAATGIAEKHNTYFQEMIKSMRHMDQLLTSFTSYVEAQNLSDSEHPEIPLDLAIRGASLKMSPEFGKAQGTITIPNDAPKSSVPLFIQDIVVELLENALKFRKDEPPHAIIQASLNDQTIHLAVMDNGMGINALYLTEIFQPFKRLHSKSEYPGDGLGLSICQERLKFLDGMITCKSEPGHGSVFTCKFLVKKPV